MSKCPPSRPCCMATDHTDRRWLHSISVYGVCYYVNLKVICVNEPHMKHFEQLTYALLNVEPKTDRVKWNF